MKPKFKYGRGYVTDYYVPPFNIDLQVFSVNVEVGERRIQATWVHNLAQDVAAFRGIDAEAELIRLLQDEMTGMMGIPPTMLDDFRPNRGIKNRYKKKFKYGK